VAEGLGGGAGGIRGLLRLLDEHAEAIEYDLLVHGYRLAEVTKTFSWRDLLVLVRRWSATPGTASGEAMQGHEIWTREAELAAAVVDAIEMGNWQRQGVKYAPKPKPVKRPGSGATGTKFGKDPIPIRDFNVWWDSN
jgi:hypothetical protein